jgi:Flp pilus assembly protein TadG
MTRKLSRSNIISRLADSLARLRADQRGSFAILMAVLLPVLMGSLALGFEVSHWYMRGRSMQNAADEAAISAASNNSPSYDVEAKAVAAHFGYVDGSNNVTVTASNNVTCPNGKTNCYRVTISSVVPLYLSQVIGFTGNGSGKKRITSTAIAENDTITVPICLLGLDTSGTDITTNGAPNSDLSGCTIMSNSDNNCNGSDLNAVWGLAAGTNIDCGLNQRSGVPPVSDPYAYMASNIPPEATACPSKGTAKDTFPQEGKGPGPNAISTLPPSNKWSGTMSLADLQAAATYYDPVKHIYTFCGDVTLTGDTTIDTSGDQIGASILIYNGRLDVRGHTLTEAPNSGLSLVFTGDDTTCQTLNCEHFPTDTNNGTPGTLDISSPKGTSAPFPGIALYQDPGLTWSTSIDFTYAGNNPVWLISGGVYFPNADLTVSGDVSQATNGADCFVMVAGTILINGTMNIYQQTPTGSGCNLQGLDQPHTSIVDRGHLVF